MSNPYDDQPEEETEEPIVDGRVIRQYNGKFYQERFDRGDGRDQFGRLLPGHTANPFGRPPKKYSLTKAIRYHLDPDEFARSILRDAYAGDNQARSLVLKYAEGLPTQVLHHKGLSQAPIVILPSNGREMVIPEGIQERFPEEDDDDEEVE